MIGQAAKDVSEPGARVDVVELAGFDQRIDGRRAAPAGVRAAEGPVFSPDGHTANGTLGSVVAHADAAVIEEARERWPSFQTVVHGLGDRVFRRQFPAFFAQPFLVSVDERFGLFLAHGTALIGWAAVDLALDGEQGVDPAHGLNGEWGFLQLRQLEELATGSMRSIAAR